MSVMLGRLQRTENLPPLRLSLLFLRLKVKLMDSLVCKERWQQFIMPEMEAEFQQVVLYNTEQWLSMELHEAAGCSVAVA